MQRLYLMRHGQTEFNLARTVQGHCDSPLTELGQTQAHQAAAWFASEQVPISRTASSPLGRAKQTLDIVIADNPPYAQVPRSDEPGLIERCYGIYENTPIASLPVDPWVPGDQLVDVGGDSEEEARERILATCRSLISQTEGNVLAIAHGAIINLFKTTWERNASCPQDVHLGNCCILEFAYDAETDEFSNTRIINPCS